MSSEYINSEVDKIYNNSDYEFPLNAALAATWILGNFKGTNLKVLDVRKTSSLSDFYILASASNTVQSKSMADEISNQLKRKELPPRSIEGKENADWILLDHGDILVHIFLENTREVYDLDDLWKDCKQVEIPQEYYFSDGHDEAPEEEPDKGYF